jgi:hypothetical protein
VPKHEAARVVVGTFLFIHGDPVMRMIAVVVAWALVVPAWSQEIAKPGPEHDLLKKREGTWTTTMKAGGMEYKGAMTYKMELGGLWLVGSLESDLAGQKFAGKSLDTFDAKKKKYVSVWFDSMSTTPMTMEGNYDTESKSLTLVGEGPGMDGKPAKWKSVSTLPDDDTVNMSMFVGDAKEPMFTIVYKRKK